MKNTKGKLMGGETYGEILNMVQNIIKKVIGE